MADLFASGHIADLVLALMVVEFVFLITVPIGSRPRFKTRVLLPNFLAGGCLVLALRTALVGAGWMVTAVVLLGALVAHLWDLSTRR